VSRSPVDPVLPTDAWDDIPVGKYLGERIVDVTPELIAARSAGWEDGHPWYHSPDNPFGVPVAPALVGAQEPWRFSGWYPPEVVGNLHAKQDWDLFWPAALGSRYVSRAHVVDRYLWRNNRHVIVNEVSLSSESGRLLARGGTHQSFLRVMPDGFAVDKNREKREDRQFNPGAGDVIERIDGQVLELTPERCLAITDGMQNYHSDPEIAKAMGFPAVVTQGVFNAYVISTLMTERFATGWWCGGKMRLSLVNVLWGGDRATAHIAVKEAVDEKPRARAVCEVWVAKPDGTVTAIGEASAVVAPG
jgi:acyl dehydratase